MNCDKAYITLLIKKHQQSNPLHFKGFQEDALNCSALEYKNHPNHSNIQNLNISLEIPSKVRSFLKVAAFGLLTTASGRAIDIDNINDYTPHSILSQEQFYKSINPKLLPLPEPVSPIIEQTQIPEPLPVPKPLPLPEPIPPIIEQVQVQIPEPLPVSKPLPLPEPVSPMIEAQRLISLGIVDDADELIKLIKDPQVDAHTTAQLIILGEQQDAPLSKGRPIASVFSALLNKSPSNADIIKAFKEIYYLTEDLFQELIEDSLINANTASEIILIGLGNILYSPESISISFSHFLDKSPSNSDVIKVAQSSIDQYIPETVSLILKHAQKTNPEATDKDIGDQFLKVCQEKSIDQLIKIVKRLIRSSKRFLAGLLLKSFDFDNQYRLLQYDLDNTFPDLYPAVYEKLRIFLQNLSGSLPAAVNFRDRMTPVKDQSTLSSCSTFSIVAALEYLFPNQSFSEAALYSAATNGDTGSHLSSYIRLLSTDVPSSTDFIPYDLYEQYLQYKKTVYLAQSSLKKEPSKYPERISDIIRYLRSSHPWVSVPNTMLVLAAFDTPFTRFKESQLSSFAFGKDIPEFLTLIKLMLSYKVPVAINLELQVLCDGENFYDDRRFTQTIVLPSDEEVTTTKAGTHAVLLCGYDDTHDNGDGTLGAFLLKNSWGTQWGDNGFCWVSYEYAKKNIWDILVIVRNPSASSDPPNFLTSKENLDRLMNLLMLHHPRY